MSDRNPRRPIRAHSRACSARSSRVLDRPTHHAQWVLCHFDKELSMGYSNALRFLAS